MAKWASYIPSPLSIIKGALPVVVGLYIFSQGIPWIRKKFNF